MKKTRFRTIIFSLIAGLILGCFWFCMPSPLFKSKTSYVLEDRHGSLLNASIAPDGQWRFPAGDSLPSKFIHCITVFEDKRFLFHPGVDVIAFARAAYRNLNNKQTVQGGSTITMQLIRLSREHRLRNIWNKFLESIMALRLELTYSKEDILNLYAAHAPFGGNVVGLEAASWRYFGRAAEKLSWGEMAALAVLPNAPSLVHPGKNRILLEKKRNGLLHDLLKNRIINRTTYNLALTEPLPGKPLNLPQLAPHLLQRFKNDVVFQKSPKTRIQTTLDEKVQKNMTDILNQHHPLLMANGIQNACALILEVKTNNVIAYAGNIYKPEFPALESAVDVIKAPRSPGSTLKPVLYAASMTDGLILPGTLLPDVPTTIGGYVPMNYDRQYDGAVPASAALSRSLNIPAVKLLQQYKYARFYHLLKELGMTTLNKPADNYGLSLILGGSEVTMWDMAGIYAGLARTLMHQAENKGLALKKDFFPPVYFQETDDIPVRDTGMLPGIDATSVWFTFQSMQEVMRPGEEGLWQQFSSSQKIAWKTGTSFGFRDAWSIGLTPDYVVAVWTGNTNGEGRAGLIGVQTAAPIMFDIFRTLPNSAWFEPPAVRIDFQAVCRESGFRVNFDCPHPDTVLIPQNGIRSPLCPYHQLVHLDPSQHFRVNAGCESPAKMVHKSFFVLPPAMEWYYKQKNHDYKLLPPFKPGCESEPGNAQMAIIYPSPNARIYVPLEISGQRGKAIFTATHKKPGSTIYWHLDNAFIGETTRYHQMALTPLPGKHVLTIVDNEGEKLSRNFEILHINNNLRNHE